MKSAATAKQFLAVFAAVAVVYALAFHFIEHQRSKNGPWRVTFASAGGNSAPFMTVDAPGLAITNVKIVFTGQTAPATNAVLVFDRPREVPFDVPMGQCVFMDAISLPGTVAFSLFGHEIQLLPRVLTIDKTEHPWQSNTTLETSP